MTFDDQLWREVWERNLDHIERHNIAVAVWRGRPIDAPFEGLVACELARRWRRHTGNLIALYALWTVFWGSLAVPHGRAASVDAHVPLACAVFGLLAIAGLLAKRRHFAAYPRARVRRSAH